MGKCAHLDISVHISDAEFSCKMAARKALVHFAQHTRPITFQTQESTKKTREVILDSIKCSFSDQLSDLVGRTLILQVCDDDWGGAFVDLLTQDVPDRSILQVVVKDRPTSDHSQVHIVIYFFVVYIH